MEVIFVFRVLAESLMDRKTFLLFLCIVRRILLSSLPFRTVFALKRIGRSKDDFITIRINTEKYIVKGLPFSIIHCCSAFRIADKFFDWNTRRFCVLGAFCHFKNIVFPVAAWICDPFCTGFEMVVIYVQ